MRSSLEDALGLQLRAAKIEPWEEEYFFAPPRRWRFDFAWPEKKVAVECEGGTWTGGRHSRGKGFEEDCHKYNKAVLLGWKVFRVTTDMVSRGEALTLIESALK